MPSDERVEPRRGNPNLDLLDSALRDSAAVLDAYARFATTLVGALLFPYARTELVTSARKQNEPERTPKSRRHGIINVVVALIIGVVLGRKLLPRR